MAAFNAAPVAASTKHTFPLFAIYLNTERVLLETGLLCYKPWYRGVYGINWPDTLNLKVLPFPVDNTVDVSKFLRQRS